MVKNLTLLPYTQDWETGIIKKNIRYGNDFIRPTMFGVHSPDEKLQISTVPEFYNQLVNVLKNIPSK